ncbi:glutamate racemase ['Osedax' symbiont bacterium Rs2_46_30_T18]|nr:glutamate racemase ['Osedax' symbiont bacterium Rs2_46_30_T18]
MQRQQPIGIFDSGVGGLSIGLAIRGSLASENLVYFADLAFAPYGIKSTQVINQRCEYIVDFLLQQGCKAIVIACNTATVNSINNLRAKFSVPIIGVEPGIKPAAEQSKTRVIGILATEQTLQSDSFAQLTARFSQQVEILSVACPKFVTLVESLKHNTDEAVTVVEQYINPLLAAGCDQIILGCTHFSFLRSSIEKVIGTDVDIIDTATAVALQLEHRLNQQGLQNLTKAKGEEKFWTSAQGDEVVESIASLWGDEIRLSTV